MLRKNAIKRDSVCVCALAYSSMCVPSLLPSTMMSERSVNNTNKKPKIMFYKAEIGVYRWELSAPVALYSHFYS